METELTNLKTQFYTCAWFSLFIDFLLNKFIHMTSINLMFLQVWYLKCRLKILRSFGKNSLYFITFWLCFYFFPPWTCWILTPMTFTYISNTSNVLVICTLFSSLFLTLCFVVSCKCQVDCRKWNGIKIKCLFFYVCKKLMCLHSFIKK